MSKADVPRLVPLPLDQIRPKLARVRSSFFFSALFRSNYITSVFVGAIMIPLFVMQLPPLSAGLPVLVALPVPCSPGPFAHVVTMIGSDQVAFDGTKMKPSDLEAYVRRSLSSTVPQSVIYVEGSNDQDFQEIVAMVDFLHGIDPNLHVGLLTPTMKVEQRVLLKSRSCH